MKINLLSLYTPIILLVSVMMTSCSSTSNIKTSRYSSVGKRESKETRSVDGRKYTYQNNRKSPKKESKLENINAIRLDIVNTAMNYQGISYLNGGKSPETGFDCSGLIDFVFTKNGIPISGSSENLAQLGKQKRRNELLPGDLVFFGTGERISHVALVSGNRNENLEVIHATTSVGVKIDTITNYEYWESKYMFGKDIISRQE
ncbi:MAG: C40 family peptidase [Saprospiraceae bacterium]|jgi:cell wall-associated NlpC family hydrolase|nr:C40 family peptidase [Saprospiraceae bacterium]MBL0027407.1 C40 family peptidase [Saprospiraceae bacterium]